MAIRRTAHRSAYAAALLAVALFAFAAVQSIVMQAQMAVDPATTTAMADMSMPDMPGMSMSMPNCDHMNATRPASDQGSQPGKGQTACPYCAAAAHLPLCAGAPAMPMVSTLAWAAYTVRPSLGPRGPPVFEPKARGPPEISLTI